MRGRPQPLVVLLYVLFFIREDRLDVFLCPGNVEVSIDSSAVVPQPLE